MKMKFTSDISPKELIAIAVIAVAIVVLVFFLEEISYKKEEHIKEELTIKK